MNPVAEGMATLLLFIATVSSLTMVSDVMDIHHDLHRIAVAEETIAQNTRQPITMKLDDTTADAVNETMKRIEPLPPAKPGHHKPR